MDWYVCRLVGCFYIFSKHEPGGGAATVYWEDQVGDIGLVDKYHVTGLVSDDAIRVYVQVVKDKSGFVIGVSGWGWFLVWDLIERGFEAGIALGLI